MIDALVKKDVMWTLASFMIVLLGVGVVGIICPSIEAIVIMAITNKKSPFQM